MRILLLGGSKSGKSSLAQRLTKELAAGGPCVYWATMEPVDHEDESRIRRHLEDREGLGFLTVERGSKLREEAVSPEASVLFDSVTALLANEMFGSGFDPSAPGRARDELLRLSGSVKNFVCVADELFRDGIDYDGTTEAYRRGLALVCRALAKEFDAVFEVVCGIPKTIKGVLPVC
ncbi:MAG: bifunctional adenosylcobinamide kinase/adenosylcobinamide-phosphate guanylyltransferase [Oscillospiraceae bacterium]|nr:bifunctional adenosylcobinamide kinase/adenosylcobinamide-phosphate guanylyltransferase [Oscillospiraceae bacterium]